VADSILRVAELVGRGLTPVVRTLVGQTADQSFFLLRLGFATASPPDLAALPLAAEGLLVALQDLELARELADAGLGTDGDVDETLLEVLAGCEAVAVAVKATAASAQAQLPGFEDRFYEYVFVTGLEREVPLLFAILALLGVVERTNATVVSPSGESIIISQRKLFTDRVGQFFSDPNGLLRDVYGWSTPSIDTAKLFANLERFATLLGPTPSRPFPTEELAATYGVNVATDTTQLTRRLLFPLGSLGDLDFTLDLYAVPQPPQSTTPQPLALTVDVDAGGTLTIPLMNSLDLELEVEGQVAEGLGLLLRPGQDPKLFSSVFGTGGGSSLPSGSIELRLVKTVDPNDSVGADTDQELLSITGGSSIRAKVLSASLKGSAGGGAGADVAIAVAAKQAVAQFSFSDADGFIGSTAPKSGISVPFDIGLSWSLRSGVTFTLSGGLEVTLPLSLSIGPVTVKAVRLKVNLNNTLGLAATADVGAAFGPVAVTIQNVGASIGLAFKRGNLGIFEAAAGFLPPNGLGVAVKSGPVSGGGFISFDPGAGRYSGALELSIYSIAVKAFGLIETKIPGGGFSFVIVISAEFTPIQLGLGFTLNGVGGLVGINRTVDGNALADQVRDVAVDGSSRDLELIRELRRGDWAARPSKYLDDLKKPLRLSHSC